MCVCVCVSEPALGQCAVEQPFLVALPGHVSSEAEEGGDVDAVHVLRVLHIAAQVELGEDALPCFLLQTNRMLETMIIILIIIMTVSQC